jgi:hypothetical protein
MTTNPGITMPSSPRQGAADRRAAAIIGVLYIIGTVGLVLSMLVAGPLLAGPAYLDQVAAQPAQLAIGALLILVAGVSLAMVPVVFWPIGRRYNETLAMGYVVFRGGQELVMYLATALGWLLLIALASQPDAAPLAGLARAIEKVAWDQLLAIPFAIGALLFYVLLYRSRLVPRWLSAWGLAGAVLYLVPPVASMFGLTVGVLMAPLAIQEMVMAAWLIAKGFSEAPVLAGSATGPARLPAAAEGAPQPA